MIFPCFGTVAAALLAAGAATLPLQELVSASGGSVAHLSIRDAKGEEEGSGSGFVISEDGRLATNFHVAEGAERMVAVFPDGKEVAVTGVWLHDHESDVAVLQLAAGKYRPLPLAKTAPKQGDEVLVIGSPLGLGHSVATGIVAAVREHGTKARRHQDGIESWGLQITAAIAPGSSGSPILNASGEVIGVAVGTIWGEAMYFGVPVARLARLLEKPATVLTPLPALESPDEPSVAKNLLISAGLFAALGLAWFVGSWWMQKRRRLPPRSRWTASR